MKQMQTQSIGIAWCDSGTVKSEFMKSVLSLMMAINNEGKFSRVGLISSKGTVLPALREDIIRDFEASGLEWCLWVDSDISFSVGDFNKLWEAKDKLPNSLICGTYFIFWGPEHALSKPVPAAYITHKDGSFGPIKFLPKDDAVKIEAGGFGFVLMHKSIAQKMRNAYGNSCFEITRRSNGDYISEDVGFFLKAGKLGIPIYAHTGVRCAHIKEFNLDKTYFELWNSKFMNPNNNDENEKS